MFGELTLLEFHLMNLTHFLLNFSITLHIRLSLNEIWDSLKKKNLRINVKVQKLDVCIDKEKKPDFGILFAKLKLFYIFTGIIDFYV